MPYTPPSHRSPSSSKSNSPTISRNNSYISPDALSPQEQHKRPHLPRSVTSTSYLQKHRRTPSISDHNDGNKAAMNGSVWSSSSRAGTRSLGPTAANGKLIRSNMASGDPHSSDEEDRRGLKSLAELHHALADIPQRRDPSPDRGTDGSVKSPSGSPVKRPPRPALTPEARKISHSRSSSELALSSLVTNIPDSLIHSTDDSEEDMSVKPPLIRKKSGELVKPALRPASHRRPSSMPGTPTFSKAVHFNDNIEQVRHFLQIDRPIAVSAGSSPVEMYESDAEYPFFSEGGSRPKTYEYEIRLVNWPRDTMERRTQPVWCEKIFLSSDSKMLVGVVAVANLAFNKFVVCRFTLDYWKTTSEVVAEFNNDVRRKYDDGYDRFNFNIKLSDQANLESKTMLLCIRYTVNDQEFWDNNNKMNYSIDFTRKPVSPPKSKAKKGAPVSGSLGAIPRSRHSPASATTQRPYSFPTARNIDDDFGSKFDNMSEFGSFNDAPNAAVLRLKGKPRKAGFLPDDARRRANPSQHGFSNRYDFSASLSAALSNAQSAIGDRSGIQPKGKATQGAPTSSVSPEQQRRILDTKAVGGVPDRGRGRGRPDTLSSEKPDLQSAEYNELIQKYCFFGSGKPSSPNTAPIAPVPAVPTSSLPTSSPVTTTPPTAITHHLPDPIDTPTSDSDHSAPTSAQSSGSNSPPSPHMSPTFDGASDSRSPPKSDPTTPTNNPPYPTSTTSPSRSSPSFLARSGSPVPMHGLGIGSRSGSPAGMYHQHGMHSGFFGDHQPTAIRG